MEMKALSVYHSSPNLSIRSLQLFCVSQPGPQDHIPLHFRCIQPVIEKTPRLQALSSHYWVTICEYDSRVFEPQLQIALIPHRRGW